MRDYRNELRAFVIITKNNVYGTDKYVVIANNFADAERVYWNELNGYHEIISISQIEDTEKVGFTGATSKTEEC